MSACKIVVKLFWHLLFSAFSEKGASLGLEVSTISMSSSDLGNAWQHLLLLFKFYMDSKLLLHLIVRFVLRHCHPSTISNGTDGIRKFTT